MKTKHFFFTAIFILFSLGSFISSPQFAHADASVVDTNATIIPNGNQADVVITGTLSVNDKARLGNAFAELLFQYGIIPNGETVTSVKLTDNAKCTAPDSANKFTCTIKGLDVGTYGYQVGILIPPHDIGTSGLVSQSEWYPFFSGYHTFFVTKNSAGATTVSFGSASLPVWDALSLSYSVDVSMKIKHLPNTTPMYILLGTATQNSGSAVYSCSPGVWKSKTQTVEPTSGDTEKIVTFSFKGDTGLSSNNYCVSVQSSLTAGGGYAVIPSGTTGETDTNGFFITPGTIIHVGDAPPLVVGATTDGTANPTGCVTKSDNSNYCLLAPLPGYGDATGNFDVTKGFGDYINLIIKIVFGLIGVLSVFMIIVNGIQYMSTVSLGEKEDAKTHIASIIMGLLLAISSFIILNTINPKLVDLGITIPAGQLSLGPESLTLTAGGGSYTGGGSGPNVTSSNISSKYNSVLKTAASKHTNVSCTLLKAFMYAESGGNPDAESGVGAKGLIQLMPATFTGLGYDISKIKDPATNADAAATYISQLQTGACNGAASSNVCNVNDIRYIIAAYNGGPKANEFSSVCKEGLGSTTTAWECTLNSGYAQTRNYVSRVQGNYTLLNTTEGWGC